MNRSLFNSRLVVIIPACNEEAPLPEVICELRQQFGQIPIVVGANGCSDRTAAVAKAAGALVAVTKERGYGHGCAAAISVADAAFPDSTGYLFLAADGANASNDIPRLVAAFRDGYALVLGRRTHRQNVRTMGAFHIAANLWFGCWCGLLTGRFFADLGPLRIIEKRAYHGLQMKEWTFGWTIEAQVKAVRLGLTTCEVLVHERRRIAGVQKVSRVSWAHSVRIAFRILAAGWRTRFAALEQPVTIMATEYPKAMPQMTENPNQPSYLERSA